MSDLTQRIVQLSEDMIMKRVPKELQSEGMETFIGYCEIEKRKTGTLKHLQEPHYSQALKERHDKAHSKTMDYLRKKGY